MHLHALRSECHQAKLERRRKQLTVGPIGDFMNRAERKQNKPQLELGTTRIDIIFRMGQTLQCWCVAATVCSKPGPLRLVFVLRRRPER
jgi:hypothetical protein